MHRPYLGLSLFALPPLFPAGHPATTLIETTAWVMVTALVAAFAVRPRTRGERKT